MPFFKDLRRRSRASFKTEKSSDSSETSHTTVPPQKSTSTLGSLNGTSTPASSIQPHLSSPHLPLPKADSFPNDLTNGDFRVSSAPLQRPPPLTAASNRYSMTSSSGVYASGGTASAKLPLSPYAPIIKSIGDNALVHQKVLLVYGQAGDPATRAFDGTMTVTHLSGNFPSTQWPVCDSHFKALIYLSPGLNRLRFDVASPKIVTNGSSTPQHHSFLSIRYLPSQDSPPLQLVLLLGKDSPGTFDAVPERVQREGNDLAMAIRKFRMGAYLWQAFTAEQMVRNNFGRRCFRFEEDWHLGSLSLRDCEVGTMRNEAKIHIVRTEKTVAELRDLDIAQQYQPAKKKTELYNIALDAVKKYFGTAPGQKQYVAAMILDTHWDTNSKVITAHAALGAIDPQVSLAVCGSHALQSFPSAIEEVVLALTDCTRTNTDFVANDGNDCGSNWEAATSNMGAHLHELGHLFGCPHQDSGIMHRDFVHFNRTFITREPYATRTREQGLRTCLPVNETGWHRLDTLRFRNHPCFKIPDDPSMANEDGVKVWAIDSGKILITAGAGIAFVELYTEGQEVCTTWIDFYSDNSTASALKQQLLLVENDLRKLLPEKLRKKTLRIEIHSGGGGKYTVEDISTLTSKKALVKMPKGQTGARGSKIGESRMEGSTPEEIILHNAIKSSHAVLQSIKVYHGQALDGMEFFFDNLSTQLFGKRGGVASEFFLNTRRGELLLGFCVRAGLWIDGIQILTSLGRRSDFYGNRMGGFGYRIIPPHGYSIAGIFGSSGAFVDGFGLIIC